MTTLEIITAPPVNAQPTTTWLIVHYARPDDDYAAWSLHVWGDVEPAQSGGYPSGVPFAGQDAFGRFAWVRLAPGARTVGFLVVDADGVKDVAADRHVDPSVTPEIWLRSGDPDPHDAPSAPVSLRPEAVIHYRRPGGDYDGWGLHCWEGTGEQPDWHRPLPPSGFDAFGAVFRVPVLPDAIGLRFVLHRGDVKDLPEDQRLDLTVTREAWLLAGTLAPVRPDVGTLGPELDPARSLAVFLDRTTIALPPRFAARATTFELAGSVTLPLIPRPGGLFQAQSRRFPHLRDHRAFSVREMGDAALRDLLRDRLTVSGRDDGGRVTLLTGVQLPGVLDDLYADAADAELGPVITEDGPQLSVWAPTARSVELELSDEIVPMKRDQLTGVWSITGEPSWLGRSYRYRVEVWHPAAQRVVTTSVTDPYSVAVGVDSTHSLLVDLSDPALMPPGWETLRKPSPVPPARMQIAEVSIREFSIRDASLPAAERGTYAAFTRPGATSVRHLRSLADAGLTHLHLLPTFDFATVPDRRADQAVPACDLAAFPPDAADQQRAVMEVAERDGFNWGYDPLHYTAPEGSFAVEPDGAARILEFRRMVAALNAAGLRVVLDVVYNHAVEDGLHRFSVLDRIVPGYYHRQLEDGSTARSTCCANTATEHTMMGRLVTDSVLTWARAYKIDGFRFDLMGHHPRANILEVRVQLDHLRPEADGVDGREIYLYGEGWNFGEVADDARFAQATQANMTGTGIGTFNDRLRDAVRGGGSFGPDPTVQGFASGLGSRTPPAVHDQIKVGLAGGLAAYRFVGHTGHEVSGAHVDYNGVPAGYASAPGETINYVDAHDNEILYDALAYKLPRETTPDDRARMQILALALVVLSQGIGFVALGSERLRSKSLDRNSFNSGDWFNQIRWAPADGNGFGVGLPPARENEPTWPWARPLLADPALIPSPEVIEMAAERYRELLRVRRSTPVFGLPTLEEVQRRLTFPLGGPHETPGVIVMCLDATGLDSRWPRLTVVFNATETPTTQRVPTLTDVKLRPHPAVAASADPLLRTATAEGGALFVPPRSVAVFVTDL